MKAISMENKPLFELWDKVGRDYIVFTRNGKPVAYLLSAKAYEAEDIGYMLDREFWEMIYSAADRGTTIFVTTHYMDEADYCSRVSIMVDGRIEALDTPAGLRTQFGAKDMNEVFLGLARKSKRTE